MIDQRHNAQDYITIALYYLMSKKEYDAITVRDICEKARISRMSFYRYFTCKEDIFINYCDARFEEFFSQIKAKHIHDIRSFLSEIFFFLQKYARQVNILKKAHKENLIVEKFTDYGKYLAKHINLSIDNNQIANKILASFLAGGTANILLLWFELGLDVPPEEMAEIATSIFRSFAEKTR
ncbi:MAG: TetR/AcrR family transcriptional regulator [Bacilli bacterium]|nr:TetR/AcrR family transcriptional regulator [Bacilli bacterium]